MGAGAIIGNAASLAERLGTGITLGAIGAGAAYVTSSALAGQKMSWGGFGKAVAMGGAGGLAGAAAGIGAAAVTRALGGSEEWPQPLVPQWPALPAWVRAWPWGSRLGTRSRAGRSRYRS